MGDVFKKYAVLFFKKNQLRMMLPSDCQLFSETYMESMPWTLLWRSGVQSKLALTGKGRESGVCYFTALFEIKNSEEIITQEMRLYGCVLLSGQGSAEGRFIADTSVVSLFPQNNVTYHTCRLVTSFNRHS